MDDQLKQRLLGATVLVALAVIFVPMLFDDKDADRGTITSTNVPALPPELQEQEIALPAAPEEVKAEGENASGSEPQERPGYRIIPLDDAPVVAQKPRSEAPGGPEKPAAEIPAEFGADEGGEPDQLPTRDSPLARRSQGGGAESPSSPSDARTPRPSAIVVPDRRKPESAERAPSGGTRAAVPRATEPKRPPPKEVAPVPPKSSAVARTKPAASAPTSAERKPPPVKSLEKSAAAAKPIEDKTADTRKPAPPVTPKSGGAAGGARMGAAENVMPAAAAKGTGTASVASRVPPEPANAVAPKPAPTAAAKIAPAKPAPVKPAETSSQKVPDKPAEAAAKKKPVPAPTAVASASPSGAGAPTKPPGSETPKASVPKIAAPASKPKQSASPTAWVIRAGSFTSESAARVLADKLKKQQFAAYVLKVSGERGTIYRVQVGPELEKNRAEQTRQRLESSAGIRGIVVSHR